MDDYMNKIEEDFTNNRIVVPNDSEEEVSFHYEENEVSQEEKEKEKREEEEKEKGEEEEEEQEEEEKIEKISYSYTDISIAVILFSIGLYCFINFLDFEINSKIIWRNFITNCCSLLHNETRCKLTSTCQDKLVIWLNLNNKSLDLLNTCCYWYAPISEYRIYSSSYCSPGCF